MLELALRLRRADFELELDWRAASRAVALFGPSGCGKTTTLLAIAGLRRPQSGRIVLDGRVLFDAAAGIDLPPAARRLGVVFQDSRLFPHLNVRDNLLFGRLARGGGAASFDAVVHLLSLGALLARRPRQLSGGEARRVALGRALLADPQALLLDEPLTGLHREARDELLRYLRALRAEVDLPLILVSHQPEEVAALAQQVLLLNDGRASAVLDLAAFRSRFAAPAAD
ncbi:MAG TPA: ATP-binding cassette domain-containing protein [Rhodanobacteraceae bacterium]|nr:ATP-binding cassette domain-containing protein [Rhodanobacteraceae bacterium]